MLILEKIFTRQTSVLQDWLPLRCTYDSVFWTFNFCLNLFRKTRANTNTRCQFYFHSFVWYLFFFFRDLKICFFSQLRWNRLIFPNTAIYRLAKQSSFCSKFWVNANVCYGSCVPALWFGWLSGLCVCGFFFFWFKVCAKTWAHCTGQWLW